MNNKQFLTIVFIAITLLIDLFASLYFIKGINLMRFLSLAPKKPVEQVKNDFDTKLLELQNQKQPLQSSYKIKASKYRGLVPETVYGITSQEVNGKTVYEIVGWVGLASEKERILTIYLSSKQKTTRVSPRVQIIEVYKNGDQITTEPRNFSDIKSRQTRISAVCSDRNCEELTTISIIDRADENI